MIDKKNPLPVEGSKKFNYFSMKFSQIGGDLLDAR